MQCAAAIAAGCFTFPKRVTEKDSDLFGLILYTNCFMVSGMSRKDTCLNFSILVSLQGKAESLIPS